MSMIPPEIKEVNELLQKRIKQLKQVKNVLSLGRSDFVAVLDDFTKTLAEFSGLVNQADVKFLQSALNEIHITAIQPIPVHEIEGAHAIAAMHNKFKSLVSTVFNSDYLPEFFQDLVKEGTNLLTLDSNSITEKLNQLKALMTAHADDLASYLAYVNANPDNDIPNKIIAQADALKAKSQNLYLEIIKLFNNISRTNNFSDQNAQQITSYSQELLDLLGTFAGKNPAISNKALEDTEELLQEIEFNLDNLKINTTNMQTMDTSIKNLSLAQIHLDLFKQMLLQGKTIISLIDNLIYTASLQTINENKLSQNISELIKNISYIKGQLGQFSKRKIEELIPHNSTFENAFNTMKNDLHDFVSSFPNEAFRILKNDVQTLLNTTKYLHLPVTSLPRKKRPSVLEITTIKNRINTKSDSIISHIGNLISAVTQIPQSGNPLVSAAMSALKAVGKSALSKLALGDAIFFTKALNNPMYLTKIGACQESIVNAMQREDISSVELSMLSTLLDYVAGETEREMFSNFISDLELQKSLAIKSVDDQINTQLKPKKRLLNEYLALVRANP